MMMLTTCIRVCLSTGIPILLQWHLVQVQVTLYLPERVNQHISNFLLTQFQSRFYTNFKLKSSKDQLHLTAAWLSCSVLRKLLQNTTMQTELISNVLTDRSAHETVVLLSHCSCSEVLVGCGLLLPLVLLFLPQSERVSDSFSMLSPFFFFSGNHFLWDFSLCQELEGLLDSQGILLLLFQLVLSWAVSAWRAQLSFFSVRLVVSWRFVEVCCLIFTFRYSNCCPIIWQASYSHLFLTGHSVNES